VCDVPCSGDGTLRKNPNVWDNWHPGIKINLNNWTFHQIYLAILVAGRGNHRHFLQYNIARRGVELLKVSTGTGSAGTIFLSLEYWQTELRAGHEEIWSSTMYPTVKSALTRNVAESEPQGASSSDCWSRSHIKMYIFFFFNFLLIEV
jgi:hypothetical protein